jgi:hypothetical protein
MRRPELEEFAERVRALHGRADLDRAAAEVVDALESAGIQPLLLKGPALVRALYTSAWAMRTGARVVESTTSAGSCMRSFGFA